ncbi:hypothetical protein GCM10023069_24300 [Shinella granuli]
MLHLHALRDKLMARLVRDGRLAHAEACFAFLPTRAKLDLLGWEDTDIFAIAEPPVQNGCSTRPGRRWSRCAG